MYILNEKTSDERIGCFDSELNQHSKEIGLSYFYFDCGGLNNSEQNE